MKHYTIGGSTADRTINCPAWIKKSENIPKRKSGHAANLGSMFHEIMERCQREGNEPRHYLDFEYDGGDGAEKIVFNLDHLPLANVAHHATNTLLDKLDINDLLIEPFVELVPKTAGGSIDLLGLSDDGETVLILDYKFGKVKVNPEKNAQMLFYALSAFVDPNTKDLFDKVKKVELAIIQPLHRGAVFRWSCDREDLLDFGKTVYSAIEQVNQGASKGNPGKHCDWCPAAPYCAEKRDLIKSTLVLGTGSQNELTVAAGMVSEVEAWVKQTKEELYLQLNRGIRVDGWKIVEKRAIRKWKDAEKAEAYLLKNVKKIPKKQLYETKLKTAPAMVTLFKSRSIDLNLDRLIEKKSSGTTLATEHDSREAVIATAITGELAKLMK